MDSERLERVHHGIELGKWVRQRRAELRITQAEVAERMGLDVDANWVTQLETGQKKLLVTQPWLSLLAQALQASEIELLQGAGVITEPLPKPGDPRPPFPPGDVRTQIVQLMESGEIPEQALEGIRQVLEGYLRGGQERSPT